MQDHYRPQDLFLVFLDINMPVMNGWGFLDELQTFAREDNTQVFVVTSSIDRADVEHAKQYALVKRFLSKPVDAEVLEELRLTM